MAPSYGWGFSREIPGLTSGKGSFTRDDQSVRDETGKISRSSVEKRCLVGSKDISTRWDVSGARWVSSELDRRET